ncbi:TonB-dependent receptor plug domain-containing protein [Ideonella sp.]|uniref:TonB-dependent receptor plug domain-containing protein n=1 Tax=Ideonella sp. TaxID=1929293 RepID=UPI0035B48CCC
MPWLAHPTACTAALTAAALTSLGGPAAAQAVAEPDPVAELELLLHAQVEGASRFSQHVLDAPALVSTLLRDTAAGLSHDTVGDMLERLPGTYLGHSRSYSTVGFRGFSRPGDYNARLLMTIDGYRVNDALYDQALPHHEFPLVADWVKRLEFVNGPASSVYGGNALLGVANVVTLDGADAPGLTLRAQVEHPRAQRGTAQFGWNDGQSDVFVGVSHRDDRGETLHLPELQGPGVPGGRVAALDGERYSAALLKWRRGAWRATLVGQARQKDVGTAEYGSAPGVPGTGYEDTYGYGELAYDGAWQGDWRWQARASLTATEFRGMYMLDDGEGGLYRNRDIGSSRWLGTELRTQWRGWINHTVSAGVEARHVWHAAQRNEDLSPRSVYLDRDDPMTQAGLYLQDDVRLSERTSLTLGGRLDHVDGFDAELSPRVALVHRPHPKDAIKLVLGQAFRAPNLSERFYDDGGASQVASPGLRPERIRSVELGWERSLDSTTRLTLAGYHYRIEGLIDQTTDDDGLLRYRNVSSAQGHGVDVDIEQRRISGWHWRASLSLNRLDTEGAPAVNAPHWLLKGHVIGPLDDRWSAGLQWIATGPRDGLRADVPAQWRADAVLRHEFATGQSLALAVRHLADTERFDPAGGENDLQRVPLRGRSVVLEWRGQF